MQEILKYIDCPDDVKKLNIQQLEQLCGEIREFLIEKVSKTGGHLASNLGAVELTLALHYVFNSPEDKIIWDVGHQTYIHKIITGRKERFDTLRQLGGLSGFPKRAESEYDCFNTGHSSTSISAALGMAKARDIRNGKNSIIAVIGDGALTGGMAYEALNHAGQSQSNIIVVLNDNEMSIARNVGGMSSYLSKIRTEPFYYKIKEDIDFILNRIPSIGKNAVKALDRAKGSIRYLLMPGVIFEEIGFKYVGPLDGHNMGELIRVFSNVKRLKGPILIHLLTQKGRGYHFAEENPDVFHGIAPFDVETGEVLDAGSGYSEVFGKALTELACNDDSIVAITAAMTCGTGLSEFSNRYPGRFFDVGIAEQHAVTFAAGLAAEGMKPVVGIYSSFLQRAYDQILHDVAAQGLHIVFAIDRAGVVGRDGETHHGIYDISYLSHIPGMVLMAPVDYSELRKMIEFALYGFNGPVALRYPREKGEETLYNHKDISLGRGEIVLEGSDITVVAVGTMLKTALEAARELEGQGVSCEVINPRFIKPIDSELIFESVKKTGRILTIEDNAVRGGFGVGVMALLNEKMPDAKVKVLGFPDNFIQHGSRSELLKINGLDRESIIKEIQWGKKKGWIS